MIMKFIKDKDYIGIVSPSSPVAHFCPQRLSRGIKFLESKGYNVLLGSHVQDIDKFTAGTAQNRADDINRMFADSRVKIIIATIGGFNANDVLDLLDYDLIRQHNDKLFIGYSDITTLNYALHMKSGVSTIMGPMILPQFAEYPVMQDFSWQSFLKVIENINSGSLYDVPHSLKWTEEMLLWDKEDGRPRELRDNDPWQIIREGSAAGILFPANLNTFCRLIGTEYFPNLDGAILFLEDDDEESSATLQRMLRHLKQTGKIDNISGIVFGRFQSKSEISYDDLKFIINNVFSNHNFPVIANLDFGHSDPVLSLPLGKKVSFDTKNKKIEIIL